jgi:hypothetical protein
MQEVFLVPIPSPLMSNPKDTLGIGFTLQKMAVSFNGLGQKNHSPGGLARGAPKD